MTTPNIVYYICKVIDEHKRYHACSNDISYGFYMTRWGGTHYPTREEAEAILSKLGDEGEGAFVEEIEFKADPTKKRRKKNA